MLTKWRTMMISSLCVVGLISTSHGQGTGGMLSYSKDSVLSVEERELLLESYGKSPESGEWAEGDYSKVATVVNHLSTQGVLLLQAGAEEMSIKLQCFTDIDGNGRYEWLCDTEAQPLWDSIDHKGDILFFQESTLAPEEKVTISVLDLFSHGITTEEVRGNLLSEKDYVSSGDLIFCISLQDVGAETGDSYYFTMDLENLQSVELLGAFAYEDVSPTSWYFSGVDFATREGLLSGVSETEFAPEEHLSRAMALYILYKDCGMPKQDLRFFSDVIAGDWYYDAFCWAVNKNICDWAQEMDPHGAVTREELVDFLAKYAQISPKYQKVKDHEGDLSQFSDLNTASVEMLDSLSWAVGTKVIEGNPSGELNPKAVTSRAEACYIFQNFLALESGVPSVLPLVDVVEKEETEAVEEES